MNTGDKIGLRNSYGDVVEHEVVYVKPHPAKAEEARVYRDRANGSVRVYDGDNATVFSKIGERASPESTFVASESCCIRSDILLTGPEAAEYVAAAREGRDAVWPPRESDPWPHWYAKEGDTFLRLYHDTENHELMSPGSDTTDKWSLPNETNIVNHGYRRITDLEAAAIKARWEEERKPPQPELPTAESVAEKVVNQQCGIGRPAIADPDQTVRLSYVVGLIANAIHRDRRLRDKPDRRVKHDWTGAMGTVLMEHDGTAFVKWDDGQVTSVYNRHLQKELE
jgi:hypothetical protein